MADRTQVVSVAHTLVLVWEEAGSALAEALPEGVINSFSVYLPFT